MYEERLSGEFSPQHFQVLKAQACAMGSQASGVMRVWNAAWVQRQEMRQHLEKMQKKKKGLDKNKVLQTTSNSEGEGMEKKEERSEVGNLQCSLTSQQDSQKDIVNISESDGKSTTAPCVNHYLKPHMERTKKGDAQAQKLTETTIRNEEITSAFPQNCECDPESESRSRGHHSEADLRSTDSSEGGGDLPLHQPLGRSLSEGSRLSSRLTSISWFFPLNVRNKHCQSRMQLLEQSGQPDHDPSISHIQNLLSERRKSESNEEQGEGCTASIQSSQDLGTPVTLLTATQSNGSNVL